MQQAMEQRIETAEEQIAHLTRMVEDLSDVVARQAQDITRLSRRVGLLLEREAEREVDGGHGIPLADQKPPHW
jgi:SlyX protein